MKTPTRSTRTAFTLLELIAVMAALIILGTVLLPTLDGMRGDTRTKAGADIVQSHIAITRNKAIEDGIPYRLAISADGRKIRMAPDTYEALGEMPNVAEDDDASSGPMIREEELPPGVTAMISETDDVGPAQDQSGWKRVATFLPVGSCREASVRILISEEGVTPVTIHIRGVTGTSTVTRGGGGP